MGNPNYSQDFGAAQSASQDSSGEVFGLHGTFQRGASGQIVGAGDDRGFPSVIQINKKSDWTMDMPKIEYQPEQDDEEEDDDDEDGGVAQNQPILNQFLSDDSADE